MGSYWNHNTAYHPWILRNALRGPLHEALDVGCGDGLLVERLASHFTAVTGIEPDRPTAQRARERLGDRADVTIIETDLAAFDPGSRRFDVITFVASIHHMDTRAAMERAIDLLAPGGRLLIVGLSTNKTLTDWLISAMALPWVQVGSRLHGEVPDVGVPLTDPSESLSEIRALAGEVLPASRIRRSLYYRYLLSWTRPDLTFGPPGATTG